MKNQAVPTIQHQSTVFVIDDDPKVRAALRWLMESVDLNVETFESAERFLDTYDPKRPGCLLLDIRMPGMGGIRLLEELQHQQIHLPVIVVTGHADVTTAIRAMKAGAVDLVQKPFVDEELLDRIRSALDEDTQRSGKTTRGCFAIGALNAA